MPSSMELPLSSTGAFDWTFTGMVLESPAFPAAVAVMVAVPAATPVMVTAAPLPLLPGLTVATAGLLLVQLIVRLSAFAGCMPALTVVVSPALTVAVAALTVIPVTACPTLMFAVALCPPPLAVTVAVPLPCAAAVVEPPAAGERESTPLLLDCQLVSGRAPLGRPEETALSAALAGLPA